MQNNDSGTPQNEPVSQPASTTPVEPILARGSFDLRKNRGNNQQNNKVWFIVVGVGVALAVALIILWSVVFSVMSEGGTEIDESTVTADTTLKNLSTTDDAMAVMQAAKVRKMAEEEEARRKASEGRQPSHLATSEKKAGSSAAPQQPSSGTNAAPPVQTAAQRKLLGGVMMKTSLAAGSGYGQAANGEQSSQVPGGTGGGGGDLLGSAPDSSGGSRGRGSLGDLSSTGFKPAKATLAPNGKYLLRHNTYARCALYTEIITDNPGLIECRLTEPLYSADGSTVLAEAGAPLTGEQRVEVGPGQTSVFTAWTELETSSGVQGVPGVRAQLDSLGAGPMGRSGTKAWIDDHTFERYSGAVMLTAFQDLLASASNATKRSNDSGYTINNSEQNVENMASKALDANMNIPRTGYLLPGTVMTVIVARDIDFSSVFENR